MSDVYAMGGEVVLALNIAGFPEDLEADVVSRLAHGRFEFQTAFGVVLRVLEQIKWARDLRGVAS